VQELGRRQKNSRGGNAGWWAEPLVAARPFKPLAGWKPQGDPRWSTADNADAAWSRRQTFSRTILPPGLIGMHGSELQMMEIKTTRFGVITVDEQRLMTFPRGLLGFPSHQRFALVQTGQGNYFFWLQSIDDASLAFVVTDPTTFFKDYEVPMRDETLGDLEFSDLKFAQVFVICNKIGDWLTGNLLGPIIVNSENRIAQQVVLTEKKWTTRQPLLRLTSEVPLAKSA
jgi:flagellar assembly factor FliW